MIIFKLKKKLTNSIQIELTAQQINNQSQDEINDFHPADSIHSENRQQESVSLSASFQTQASAHPRKQIQLPLFDSSISSTSIQSFIESYLMPNKQTDYAAKIFDSLISSSKSSSSCSNSLSSSSSQLELLEASFSVNSSNKKRNIDEISLEKTLQMYTSPSKRINANHLNEISVLSSGKSTSGTSGISMGSLSTSSSSASSILSTGSLHTTRMTNSKSNSSLSSSTSGNESLISMQRKQLELEFHDVSPIDQISNAKGLKSFSDTCLFEKTDGPSMVGETWNRSSFVELTGDETLLSCSLMERALNENSRCLNKKISFSGESRLSNLSSDRKSGSTSQKESSDSNLFTYISYTTNNSFEAIGQSLLSFEKHENRAYDSIN